MLIEPNVASTIALSVGVRGRARWIETPSRSHARVKVSDTNTFPPSITIVSGTMTGRATASSIRVAPEASVCPAVETPCRFCRRLASL